LMQSDRSLSGANADGNASYQRKPDGFTLPVIPQRSPRPAAGINDSQSAGEKGDISSRRGSNTAFADNTVLSGRSTRSNVSALGPYSAAGTARQDTGRSESERTASNSVSVRSTASATTARNSQSAASVDETVTSTSSVLTTTLPSIVMAAPIMPVANAITPVVAIPILYSDDEDPQTSGGRYRRSRGYNDDDDLSSQYSRSRSGSEGSYTSRSGSYTDQSDTDSRSEASASSRTSSQTSQTSQSQSSAGRSGLAARFSSFQSAMSASTATEGSPPSLDTRIRGRYDHGDDDNSATSRTGSSRSYISDSATDSRSAILSPDSEYVYVNDVKTESDGILVRANKQE